MSKSTTKTVLSNNKNIEEKTYRITEDVTKVKTKKKSGIYYVGIAQDFLKNYLSKFGTKIIENSMELDSFEMVENEKNEVNYEVTISYYTKNKTFDLNTNSINQIFQPPNVKNYRKIVLNKEEELLKITSKID